MPIHAPFGDVMGIIMGVGSFIISLQAGVLPTVDPSAETFISVQCASP